MNWRELAQMDVRELVSAHLLQQHWSLQLGVMAACGLFGLAAGWFWFAGDAWQMRRQAIQEQQTLSRMLAQKSVLAAQARVQEDAHTQAQQASSAVAAMLAEGRNNADWLEHLHRAAKASGVELQQFHPATPVNTPTHQAHPVTVGVSGAFSGLRHFSQILASQPGLITWHEIRLRRQDDDDNGTLHLEARMQTYRRGPHASGALAEHAEPTVTPSVHAHVATRPPHADPFRALATPRPRTAPASHDIAPDQLRPREPLEAFALNTLRMAGTVSQGEQFFALIQTPEHTLVAIRAGQYLGQNHGRITRVTPRHIDIEEITRSGNGPWTRTQASLQLQE